MLIVVSMLVPVFLVSLSAAAAGSSRSTSPGTAGDFLTDGISELLRSCFDKTFLDFNGPLAEAQFTITARDEFRDVELTFVVTGDELGNRCKLEWDGWLVPCGRIKSTHHDTGKTVDMMGTPMGPLSEQASRMQNMAGITIDIYGGDHPHWELTTYSPNNLLSDNFMKSFVAQGLRIHTQFLQKMSPQQGKIVFLRLSDLSPIRELYWLEHQTGRTYFEDFWNMEYECLCARMDTNSRKAYYDRARVSYMATALLALGDGTFGPIKNAWSWEHPISVFAPFFIKEITIWFQKNGYPGNNAQLSSMNLVVALEDFIPQWRKNLAYTQQQQIKLAQNTFMFFFRHHPQFDILARQVLSGYDDTCIFMTGIPHDNKPYSFGFKFIMDPAGMGEASSMAALPLQQPLPAAQQAQPAFRTDSRASSSGSPGLTSAVQGMRVNSPALGAPRNPSPLNAAPRNPSPLNAAPRSEPKALAVASPQILPKRVPIMTISLMLLFLFIVNIGCAKAQDTDDYSYAEL